MRILILEDEPIIAIDLEDIVTQSLVGADCVLASTVDGGMRSVEQGLDFALLDINLGHDRNTCFPVAAMLMARRIPFCFVTSSKRTLPADYMRVPFIAKPFQPSEILEVLPVAA